MKRHPLLAVVALSAACAAPVRPAAQPTAAPPTPKTTAALSPAPTAVRHSITVVIDPGHNGGNASHTREINRLVDAVTLRKPCDTTGTATNAGYSESAFNFDVARRVAALLRARSVRVVL